MGKVLFVSQNPLDRAENMRAVWDAYDGDKEFKHGIEAMRTAEADGYSVVVCDALPQYIEGKDRVKVVNICHGMTGNKVYGMDEDGPWVNSEAFAQTDVAIAASERIVPIVAQELGIPEDRVMPLGFARTDSYFSARKGDGGTFLAGKRAYLYAPTYRDENKGGWLPRIDWVRVSERLMDDEVMVIKRHYFTSSPLLGSDLPRVVEVDPSEPLTPYLVDCDVVLSDYSSLITDAYLMGKPVVLATDDMHVYLRDRPMYFPYPETYCSMTVTAGGNEGHLLTMLRMAHMFGLGEVERDYLDRTAGACDGHSAERICDLIRSLA